MAMVINTNIASLNAQRNLNGSQSSLATSLQRLSSGLRINSAKDDAAGLAISERFTTQIRGINQAVRNANDGISLSQTAEGAMAEIGNNLQRVRELAVQARNATNSESDRAALDAEVQQRINEVNRVATQTQFNGLNLLDGSFTNQVFQVGANFGQTITVDSIAAATGEALGLAGGTLTDYRATGTAISGANLVANDLKIAGTDIGAVDVTTNNGGAKALAEAINAKTGITGVTATAGASSSGSLGAFTTTSFGTGQTYQLNIGGVDVFATPYDASAAGLTAGALDTQLATTTVSDALDAAGITVSGTAAGGNLTFSKADGSTLVITETLGGGATGGFTTTLNGGAQTSYGSVTLDAGKDFTIEGNGLAKAGLSGVSTTENQVDYSAVSVKTADDADTVLRVVDAALTQINSSRADLGAVQNRFESVIANLSTTSENLSGSRSRILDADFAAETANLTRGQILQQAGTAMLAQANSLPNGVLALLRG
jgi:flagellin